MKKGSGGSIRSSRQILVVESSRIVWLRPMVLSLYCYTLQRVVHADFGK